MFTIRTSFTDSIRAAKNHWQSHRRLFQAIAALVAIVLVYELLLIAVPADRELARSTSQQIVADDTQPVQWDADSNDSALGYRLFIAAIYVGLLTAVALLIRRWKKGSTIWSQAIEEPDEAIIVRQRKRVSPQLTLLVVEISGRKVLVAASPQAVSMTILDGQ